MDQSQIVAPISKERWPKPPPTVAIDPGTRKIDWQRTQALRGAQAK